jgi:FKBP-type peptidyl-prolyl cis-trans isomerase 2
MKVTTGLMVRCEYDLSVAGGEVIESSSKTGPIVYKHGDGKMLPALEERLEGMEVGEERSGTIPASAVASLAESAPALAVPRSNFPADAKLEVGSMFEAKDAEGRPIRLEIRAVDGDQVTARAVHPLAGKELAFRVKVLSLQAAPPPVPSALSSDELIELPPSDPALAAAAAASETKDG